MSLDEKFLIKDVVEGKTEPILKCPNCNRTVIKQSDQRGETFPWPSFLKDKNNKGQCMPCCFKPKKSGSPGDIDVEKVKRCLEIPYTAKRTQNNIYIQSTMGFLAKDKYSYLPKHLDNYFMGFNININKPTDIRVKGVNTKDSLSYYGWDGKKEIANFNFFCLKGVGDEKYSDFLSSISDLYSNYIGSTFTRSDIVKLIIDKLSLKDFKTVNNGISTIS